MAAFDFVPLCRHVCTSCWLVSRFQLVIHERVRLYTTLFLWTWLHSLCPLQPTVWAWLIYIAKTQVSYRNPIVMFGVFKSPVTWYKIGIPSRNYQWLNVQKKTDEMNINMSWQLKTFEMLLGWMHIRVSCMFVCRLQTHEEKKLSSESCIYVCLVLEIDYPNLGPYAIYTESVLRMPNWK